MIRPSSGVRLCESMWNSTNPRSSARRNTGAVRHSARWVRIFGRSSRYELPGTICEHQSALHPERAEADWASCQNNSGMKRFVPFM